MDNEHLSAVSVIIPAHNAEKYLPALLDSLSQQSVKPAEIIVIDDYSIDSTKDIASDYGAKTIKNSGKNGPAAARNLGIKSSTGEILAFIDADCISDKDWIKNIREELNAPKPIIIMGKVEIPKSTFLGDVMSSLGFPAGGHIGFENIWRVNREGKTDHISSCNFALRKETILKVGLFDETFPYPGCEDVELSMRCVQKGIPIYYRKNVVIIHPPRKDLFSFIKWHISRGRGNYHLKRKIGKVGNLIMLRIWSSKNICKKYMFDIKFPFILFFLFLSFVLQQMGYLCEKLKKINFNLFF